MNLKKEESEKDAVEGMRILREKLRKAEMDLENAKFIATSALVKLEDAKRRDLDMSIDGAFGADTHTLHSLEEKAIELDLLASATGQPSSAVSSPSRSGSQFSQQQHRQQQPQPNQSYGGGFQNQQQMQTNGVNGWTVNRSRLADF